MFLSSFEGAEHAGGVSFWIGVEEVSEKTSTCRSLIFPAGPVKETLASNVAMGFPMHLEWCLYNIPSLSYGHFKVIHIPIQVNGKI